jgi:hypothetical protein
MREQRSRRSAGNVHWAWAKAYVITLAHKLITVEVFGSALKRRLTATSSLRTTERPGKVCTCPYDGGASVRIYSPREMRLTN